MSKDCVKNGQVCPLDVTLRYLGKKWSFHIIKSLFLEKHHFHEILESYPDMSAKVLSERLKELEDNGLIQKKITPTTPVTIEYFLTKKGKALNRVIYELGYFAFTQYKDRLQITNKEFKQMEKYYREKFGI